VSDWFDERDHRRFAPRRRAQLPQGRKADEGPTGPTKKRGMTERFELIDKQCDISGHLRLRYGSGHNDPMPFVITVTSQYVARASGKTPPVSLHEIEKYADDNAGDLRAKAVFEKGRGFTTLTLE
jgi:hypothetical protein